MACISCNHPKEACVFCTVRNFGIIQFRLRLLIFFINVRRYSIFTYICNAFGFQYNMCTVRVRRSEQSLGGGNIY